MKSQIKEKLKEMGVLMLTFVCVLSVFRYIHIQNVPVQEGIEVAFAAPTETSAEVEEIQPTTEPTPVRYAGPSGKPCIKAGCWNYFGQSLPSGEFEFRLMGVVNCYDSHTGKPFKFTWYSSKVLYHKDTASWILGDDLIYRDAAGYIILAGNTYRPETTFGTVHDTPFGLGKVYDHCEMAEQIDCFDVYCRFSPL